MKKRLLILLVAGIGLGLKPGPVAAQKPPLTRQQYQQDFDFFWNTIRTNYCYFASKQTDWEQVRARSRPQLDTLSSRRAFVRLLENSLAELYDNHAGLSTNRPDSRRLVPTGTDIWAEFVNGQAVVQAVRPGFGAERSGVRPGMVLTAVNGVDLNDALRPFLPTSQRGSDAAARNFALLQLLAGDHRTPRTWSLLVSGRALTAHPDEAGMALENISYSGRFEARRLGRVGYLKINNSLGDNGLIVPFDSALTALMDTQGLVLDLRETPSGGNTTVARAIMGRFIKAEAPYQRHELTREETQTGVRRIWLEIVAPRGPRYTAPVVVLVGRWTGSMGEGLAIGFDALQRAKVVGTEMARLHGGIYSYSLPHSGIGFNIPVERLSHVNGQPRESFRPPIYVDPKPGAASKAEVADPALEAALQVLRSKR
ncbi:S41 family peptidase [Hymenobacter arizonensis]|uniref:Carboxyl-terminal processing protease n=1 Tax=Hymenobacter arizonensis TaxID=1227077 RepID=A0A1I6AEG5_HYMAR|nr:S41 family peptidase [Hymenobacter arizonensis]SFQ67069.1 carboxyl-terminal processing protease [Hymenobacter arizonensis]